jgi:transposase
MRGEDQRSEGFFSYVRLECRIPADHPLRAIRELVDAALGELSRSFDRLYSRDGRPSIPPERLLRALLLQAFYTVRSERQRRYSARTGTGCSTAISRTSSLSPC